MTFSPHGIKMAVRTLQVAALTLIAVTLIIQVEAVFTLSFDTPDWQIELLKRVGAPR